EVRGARRKKRGTMHPPKVEQARVTLSYTGLDEIRRQTVLRFDPAPKELTGERAVYEVTLKPRQTRQLFVEICCGDRSWEMTPRRQFFSSLLESRRSMRNAVSAAASIATSNDVFNEAVRR